MTKRNCQLRTSSSSSRVNLSAHVLVNIIIMSMYLGAIIPMRELEQYIGELYSQGKENTITFYIYPGRDDRYTLYLDDDGLSRDAETKKKYRLTEISHKGVNNGQQVRVKRVHDKYKPVETYYYIGLLGTVNPKSVKIGVLALEKKVEENDEASSKALAESKVDGYYYNSYLKTTYIKIFDTKVDLTLDILF